MQQRELQNWGLCTSLPKYVRFGRCCNVAEILAVYLATQFTNRFFKWHEICNSWLGRFIVSKVSAVKLCSNWPLLFICCIAFWSVTRKCLVFLLLVRLRVMVVLLCWGSTLSRRSYTGDCWSLVRLHWCHWVLLMTSMILGVPITLLIIAVSQALK